LTDWTFAQSDPAEQLAKLHYFSMKKRVEGGEVEIRITVYEYYTPKDPTMKFLALADKPVNQKLAAIRPVGWGDSLLTALAECMRVIKKFPYDGPAEDPNR
jgi:hypothetical protein